jgi:ribosome-binding factor A
MKPHRREKLISAIREAAGKYLAEKRFEKAMVTVTSVDLNKNFKRANICVSIFPEDKEKKITQKLNRGKGLFAKYIKKNTRISLVPILSFSVDEGEKHRQRIDEVSKEI